MTDRLSLDCLDRVQRTLQRRVIDRDPENIISVGFAPATARNHESSRGLGGGVTAQFEVLKKLKRVSDDKRIRPIETVRLLDRERSRFRKIDLATSVFQAGDVVPTGVRISTLDDHATTSIVVRWTTVCPVPPQPTSSQPDDPRWRWGLMTVSHLFVGRGNDEAQSRAQVQRVAACGDGPDAIASRVAARGRIPGGPDVAVVETGWDRLWLSGFLPEIGLPPLQLVSASDLERWARTGVNGEFAGNGVTHHWKWDAFYPSLMIPTLGRLQHLVAYDFQPQNDSAKPKNDSAKIAKPFGPGTSGGAIVADGLLIGIQIAAMQPRFEIGYAQTLDVGVAWLRNRLHATALELVHVVSQRTSGFPA